MSALIDHRFVTLAGTGIVGTEILRQHLLCDIPSRIIDVSMDSIRQCLDSIGPDGSKFDMTQPQRLDDQLIEVRFFARREFEQSLPIVIESIPENLELKQRFIAKLCEQSTRDTVLCSNTSTLSINRIAEHCPSPNRVCGLHFFMPVTDRHGVEVIAGDQTDQSAIETAISHAGRLGKNPIRVRDSPGFIVNRLLAPYLNESMLMLGRGVDPRQLEEAALRYGMPLSPLELCDWIGAPTMFDAGKAVWQAFPRRYSPSPMLAKLVRSKRVGRGAEHGFYDYHHGQRSRHVAPYTLQLAEEYRTSPIDLDTNELMHILAVTMWVEAALCFHDRVVDSMEQFDHAMHGGLGYDANRSWIGFFDTLGSPQILQVIEQWSSIVQPLMTPPDLLELLQSNSPSEAMRCFAGSIN